LFSFLFFSFFARFLNCRLEHGESDLGVTYADFLADAAKKGALEKGRGALVLCEPVNSLKSWFEVIQRKLRANTKLPLEELSKGEFKWSCFFCFFGLFF
jgi:hypothetical protein